MSPVVKVPSPVLRGQAKTVEDIDKKITDIISDMYRTLIAQTDPEGVGLAAPQIGVPLRIFITRPITGNKKLHPPTLFINPVITNYSRDSISHKAKDSILEGCLSLPSYYGYVKRSKHVTVEYQTFQDFPILPASPIVITITRTYSDFPSQIIQHEFDHLNGTLFIDKILEQKGKLYEINGDTWTQIDL